MICPQYNENSNCAYSRFCHCCGLKFPEESILELILEQLEEEKDLKAKFSDFFVDVGEIQEADVVCTEEGHRKWAEIFVGPPKVNFCFKCGGKITKNLRNY